MAPALAVVLSLTLATFLVWGGHSLIWVWIGGLLSIGVGVFVVLWATRGLSDLSRRAIALAGASLPQRKPSGSQGAIPSWDVALSRALDEIERNLEEIQSLNRVTQFILSGEDLDTVLGRIVEEAVALLRANAGIIGLWDAERQVFKDIVGSNMPIAFPGREFGPAESFTSQVAKSGQVIFLDNYMDYPHRIRELDWLGLRATLGAPLMVKGQSRGALTVQSTDPERRFTPLEGELLATFASQAGSALEGARMSRVMREQVEELAEAHADLAQKTRELEQALSIVVRVQEHERSRIAADVHDGVVQLMVGSLLELQAAMAQLPKDPGLAAAKQLRARGLIQEAVAELRRVIFDLRPAALDRAGLVPALESLIKNFSELAGYLPTLRVIGAPYRLSAEVETAAYRIVQESLNNVLKHSQASAVDVRVSFGPENVEMAVSDNGKGFALEGSSSTSTGGVGLIGIKERGLSVGGQVHVSSMIGRGTEVMVILPRSARWGDWEQLAESPFPEICNPSSSDDPSRGAP